MQLDNLNTGSVTTEGAIVTWTGDASEISFQPTKQVRFSKIKFIYSLGDGTTEPEEPGTGGENPEEPGTGGETPETPGTGEDVEGQFTFDLAFTALENATIDEQFSGNGYAKRTIEYEPATLVLDQVSKQNSTITEYPVFNPSSTRPAEAIITLKDDSQEIKKVTYTLQQWNTKAQKAQLYTSNGSTKTETDADDQTIEEVVWKAFGSEVAVFATSTTGATYTLASEALPAGTVAVKIDFPTNSNQIAIAKIVMEYGESTYVAPAVESPVFTIEGTAEFFTEAKLTISPAENAAEGTEIYYTKDSALGTAETPDVTAWTKYTEPMTITETCTVYAVAKNGDDLSAVATQEFVKNPTYASIAALPEATETAQILMITGEMVVVGNYADKGYLYLRDVEADASLLLYDAAKKIPAYQPGEKLSGLQMSYALYRNNPQGTITNYVQEYPAPTAEEIPAADVPQPILTVEWNAESLNQYVNILGARPYKDGNNTYIDLGEDKVQLYNGLGIALPEFEENGLYDIVGYTLNYNSTKEIYYVSSEQCKTAEPAIAYNKDEGITFTATEGAALGADVKIYYTLKSEKNLAESALADLADPVPGAEGTTEWNGEAIEIADATVIKAIAVKAGYAASSVAELYINQDDATMVGMLIEDALKDVEYYDLNGRRVSGSELERGIYIERRGRVAKKMVR